MAGRLQIETVGKQDKFLTDDPEFSFFNQVHKKHTHFSRQNIRIESPKPLEFDQILRYRIPQNQGYLLTKIAFEFEMDPVILFNHGYVDSFGHALFDYIDLYIGGVLVERVNTDYLQIFSEQSITQTKQYGLSKTLGKSVIQDSTDDYTNQYAVVNYNRPQKFIVNVPFHFYQKPEIAIPICAIKTQEVEIEIKTRKLEELILSKAFTKFVYPTVPYQAAYNLNTNQNILDIRYIPNLDTNQKDGTTFGGIGMITSQLRIMNRLTPYIWAHRGDRLEYYGVSTKYVRESIAHLTIESIAYTRFQSNFLYRQNDPALPEEQRITSGRIIGTGTQFHSKGMGVATTPKYNQFYIGDPIEGMARSYINNDLLYELDIGIGYGQSVGVDDEGEIAAFGFTSNIDPAHITTFENTIKVVDYTDPQNPFVSRTLTASDSTAQLRYVKVSGHGKKVGAFDIVNNRLYVFDIETEYTREAIITGLDPNTKFDFSYDGLKLVVGLYSQSQYRTYGYDKSTAVYSLGITKDVYNPLGNSLHVAMSRDGNIIYYSQDYSIKTDSLQVLDEVKVKDFKLVADFILLDKYEKNIVENTCRDYAFTQVQQADNQLIPLGEYDWTMRSNFINPIKEFYFVFQCLRFSNDQILSACNYDNIGREIDHEDNINYFEHMYNIRMILDNEEVLTEESGKTFFLKSIQSGLHHKRTPMSRRFYSYSFATEPEKGAPTGQRNFSLIRNQIFKVKLVPQNIYRRELRIYGLSYNVFRISDGEIRMLFPYRCVPVPTSPNNSIGPNDRIPFLFANQEGYMVPCECPDAPNCPDPEDVPGEGFPQQ